MAVDHREELRKVRTFPQLVKYLRDRLDWPIESESFEDLTFDYEPEELGLDAKTTAKIESIKQLRPMTTHQPWGIFFVKFEPRRLPVVALRRILSKVVFKKRASANRAERAAWATDDLLFVSNYGEGDERRISSPTSHKARAVATCRRSRSWAGTTSIRLCTWTTSPRRLPPVSLGPLTRRTRMPGARAGAPPSPCVTGRSSPRRRNSPFA